MLTHYGVIHYKQDVCIHAHASLDLPMDITTHLMYMYDILTSLTPHHEILTGRHSKEESLQFCP